MAHLRNIIFVIHVWYVNLYVGYATFNNIRFIKKVILQKTLKDSYMLQLYMIENDLLPCHQDLCKGGYCYILQPLEFSC